MSKKSFLMQKIDEAYYKGFAEGLNKGIKTGIQYNNDIYQCVLHDPQVMGRDTFGPKRMEKIHIAAETMCDVYFDVMHPRTNPEADVWQEKLDTKLRKIWRERLVPFALRYPYIADVKYEGRAKK